MSIFLQATKSGWYPEFLKSVVEAVASNSNNSKILDIGTGPGTLSQMLIEQNENLQITGVDIDKAMVAEAKRRTKHQNLTFLDQQPNEPLPFENNTFDAVTFCSVLFLVDDSTRQSLMSEALRVLKPNGKIIVLTPSSNKPILSSFAEVWKYPFSFNNYTFIVWKIATTNSGQKWQQQKWLEQYSSENQLNYNTSLTFNNNTSLETISKQVND